MATDPTAPQQIALAFSDDDAAVSPEAAGSHDRAEAAPSSDTQIPGSYHVSSRIPSLDDFDVSLLALARVRGIGPKTIRLLIDQFEDLKQVWTASQSSLTTLLQRAKIKEPARLVNTLLHEQVALLDDASHDWQQLQAKGIHLIGRTHPCFPDQFSAIPDAPQWLFVEGNLAALKAPLIGIVGTRTPSKIGVQTAERLAAVVCREGFGIVSGLAEGIDASAHRVGLYYQAPQIAVLGTGIDIVFPASTERIRWKLIEAGGAVVSEYFPGDSYSRANFVQRNRIQAALSLAIAPVESRAQSGTSHTLRFAEQYRRPIFGVQRGQPAAQNEMLGILGERGYPLFDLADHTGVKHVLAWLRTVIPPQSWPSARRQMDVQWFFADVLRQIDDILDETPVSERDLAWLQGQIAQRIDLASGQGSQDRS